MTEDYNNEREDDYSLTEEDLERIEKTLRGEEDSDPETKESDQEQDISIGLTPNGGVGIKVTDSDGDSAAYFISDPAELWQIAGHLQSLSTILVQTRYAMIMQEQKMMEELMKKQTLVMPGHGPIA